MLFATSSAQILEYNFNGTGWSSYSAAKSNSDSAATVEMVIVEGLLGAIWWMNFVKPPPPWLYL